MGSRFSTRDRRPTWPPIRSPLVDPFPVRGDGTRFDQPFGNRLGLLARAGQSQTFFARDYKPAAQQRWRIGIQREITPNMVFEISYNGALSKIPVNQPINFLPQPYWATGNVRRQEVDTELNRNVTNPFLIGNLSSLKTSDPLIYSYLATLSFFSNGTTRKNQLLRPFPQMSTLTGVRPGLAFDDTRGDNRYHDLQLLLERRFSRGFQSAVMYTYATSDVQDWYANEFDPQPSWEPNNNVRPHRFVWSAIYEFPFGRGRRWVQSGPIQHIIGGWQLSWVYQFQSGPVTSWGNRFFYGDLSQIDSLFRQDEVHSKDIHVWFDPTIAYTGTGAIPAAFQGFEGRSAMQPGQFHVNVFPASLDAMRADGIRNWDVKMQRRFRITERLRTSLSLDLLNATNHTNFGAPGTDPTNKNFGRVTSQNGLGRRLQFNLRVDF